MPMDDKDVFFSGLTVVFLAWRFYRHMGQQGYLNAVGLVLGSITCFGVIMVGNFQVSFFYEKERTVIASKMFKKDIYSKSTRNCFPYI